MKKLLIITDLYPNKYNQVAGVFVMHQAIELRNYFDVRVISSSFSYPYEVNTLMSDGIELTSVYFPIWKKYFLSSIIAYRTFALPVIKKLCRSWQPDYIHVHDCRHVPELFQLNNYLSSHNIPRFLSLHNIKTHPTNLGGNLLSAFYNVLLSKALSGWNHVFCVNDNLRNWVLPYTTPKRISVIGNAIHPTSEMGGIDLSQFQKWLMPQTFKVIAAGNLVVTKGYDLLLQAVHKLISTGMSIQLLIIGAGEDENRLRKIIESLNLSDIVMMPGSFDNASLRQLYPLFDAFILPSYSETFGIVYLEAMYAGIATVGVKGQGIDGVITDRETGFLLAPKSIDAIVELIIYLEQNPEQVKIVAKRGAELVRMDYMLPKLIKQMVGIYDR